MIRTHKKVSTTVYLTGEQNAALHELSARTKVPIAEYVRQGVDLFLKQESESQAKATGGTP